MTVKVKIRVKRLADVPLPEYHSQFARGWTFAPCSRGRSCLRRASAALIPTGLVIAIPEGFEGQLRPRSGLALRHGVTVLQFARTIDSDYRGEVKVVLINHGQEEFVVCNGRPESRSL